MAREVDFDDTDALQQHFGDDFPPVEQFLTPETIQPSESALALTNEATSEPATIDNAVGSVTSRLPSASAPSPPKPPSPSRVEPVSTSFHTNMSMEVTTDKVSAMALARYANTVLNGLTLLNQSQPPRMFMRVSKSADYRPTWIITPS